MSKKLTTEEFIQKAKQVHGDKYDYSLVDYKGAKIKVKIICPKHGIFEQIPDNHVVGRGCNKCGNINSSNKQSLTIKKFIQKAKQVHGNKYDYSLVDYKNMNIKVKIICPEHGIFKQLPSAHIASQGCFRCNGGVKYTTKEFTQKAKQVHGDKYDYSLVDYKNMNIKVKIICPEHGIFKQLPSAHIAGRQCSKCSNRLRYTTEEFTQKAKQVHGDKYDYSLVDYKNNKIKVKIICPEHGIFKQKPIDHILGGNCSKCSQVYQYTTEEFIDKAKEVHDDKYNYSLTNYINNKTKVDIICPEHGVFKQKPANHLYGQGCPICNESKGEKAVAKYLDDNNIKYIREYRFNDCKDKRVLPFDFYIKNKNVLIEFDGGQHKKAIEYFGGKEGLENIKRRDIIKTQYAKRHNIKLIRINNINEILDKLKHILI